MAGEHCRWVWEQNILLAFPQWMESIVGGYGRRTFFSRFHNGWRALYVGLGAEHSSRVSTMAGEHCRWVWEQNILLAFPQWLERIVGGYGSRTFFSRFHNGWRALYVGM